MLKTTTQPLPLIANHTLSRTLKIFQRLNVFVKGKE
jgi:hypothetical protein